MLFRLFSLSAALALFSCSAPASPRPAEPVTAEEPVVVEAATPDASAASDPAAPQAGQPDYEVEEITKIRECDEYLALYRFCEPRLKEEIMAGDRRTYRAERASLEYFLTTPERAGMPDACADMLHALEEDCLTR